MLLERIDRIVRMRCADRLPGPEPFCLKDGRWDLLLEPIVDHRPFGNSPLPFPLLKQIAVAAAEEGLAYFSVFVRSALQRVEITLDRGLCPADEFDQDVRDLMDVARLGLEDTERKLDEALCRAAIGPVIVMRIGPVRAAQRRLIRTVYTAAVSIEAVADRLSVEEFGSFCLVHRLCRNWVIGRGVSRIPAAGCASWEHLDAGDASCAIRRGGGWDRGRLPSSVCGHMVDPHSSPPDSRFNDVRYSPHSGSTVEFQRTFRAGSRTA